MPSRTRKSKEFKMAFLLDEPAFRRLVSTVQDVISRDEKRAEQPELFQPTNEIDYFVTFSDGSSLECDSVEEVTQIPNSQNRKITSISLTTSEHRETRVELSFRGSSDDSVQYGITGTERDVFYFSNQTEEQLSALRQWYSPIATAGIGIFLILAVFLMSWLVVGAITLGDSLGLEGSVDTVWEGLTLPLVMFVALAVVFGPIWLLGVLRDRLFPVGVFAFGDGAARYKRLQRVHTVVASILFVSIGVGLFVSFLADRLF